MKWEGELADRFLQLRGEGKSLIQVAKILGVTPGAANGAHNRLEKGYVRPFQERSRRKAAPTITPVRWTETALTETWSERKCRLAQERNK